MDKKKVKRNNKIDYKLFMDIIAYCISVYENNKVNIYEDVRTKEKHIDLNWSSQVISSLYMELDNRIIFSHERVMIDSWGFDFNVDGKYYTSELITKNQGIKIIKDLIKEYPFLNEIIDLVFAMINDKDMYNSYLKGEELFFSVLEKRTEKIYSLK